MAQQTVIESKPLTFDELREFGSVTGPCITIFLPVDAQGGPKRRLTSRLKAAAEQAESQLGQRPVVSTVVRKIMDPLTELASKMSDDVPGRTLLLFASEQGMRTYPAAAELPETVVAADNFYIRPLLDSLGGELTFYLLALSQKDVRLLRCTEHSSEELDLQDRVPNNLRDFLQTRKPDHVMDNRVTAGVSSAGAQGVMFTTNTDREDKDEYLLHFFKAVSRGVSECLRSKEKTPLVLCGVEHELAMFKPVNTWENTCPETVRGAPNSLKGGEMHSRALDCIRRWEQSKLDSVLAQHDRQGGDVATAGVNEIVKAAYEGRVLHLFAASNATAMGNFDEASHRARTHQVPRSGDEDLINAAAIQTILHDGKVTMMPQARVPGNRPLAALMRY